MVEDPYKVLGISQSATPDEIKSAYRKMAKQYHPDLHPNDPKAAEKMNEINEAYDMLQHPEKYAQRRAQQQAQQQARQQQQSYYGGYGQSGYQQGGYSQNGYSQNGYGQGGGFGDFGGFGFEDFFGFGAGPRYGSYQSQTVTEQPGDSPVVRQAVRDINARQYQQAVNHLATVQAAGRNARWYYLNAMAHNGMGNTMTAMEQMQKAVQMDPNNQEYHMLLNRFRSASQTYESNAGSRGFNFRTVTPQLICGLCCLANMCCNSGACCSGYGGYGGYSMGGFR